MVPYRHAVIHVIASDASEVGHLVDLFSSVKLTVAVSPSASAFVKELRPNGLGCVVADTEALDMDLNGFLHQLRQRHLPVVLLSASGDVSLAVRAMKAGAADFLEKPFNGQALLDTVNEALEAARGAERRKVTSSEMRARFESLTERERQVLLPMIRGAPNRRIAADLGVREKTIEVYRGRVLRKVGAANLSELIRMALRAWPDGDPSSSAGIRAERRH